MLKKSLPRYGTPPVHDIEHPGRQHSVDQLHEFHRSHGREAGRLQHHAVSRRERRSELPEIEQQGHIPRANRADHANRLTDDHDSHSARFTVRSILAGTDQCGKIGKMLPAHGQHVLGNRQRPSGFQRFRDTKSVHVPHDPPVNFHQRIIAARQRQAPPCGKRRSRGPHGPVHVAGRGGGNGAQLFSVGGACDVHAAALAFNPFPIDIQRVMGINFLFHCLE